MSAQLISAMSAQLPISLHVVGLLGDETLVDGTIVLPIAKAIFPSKGCTILEAVYRVPILRNQESAEYEDTVPNFTVPFIFALGQLSQTNTRPVLFPSRSEIISLAQTRRALWSVARCWLFVARSLARAREKTIVNPPAKPPAQSRTTTGDEQKHDRETRCPAQRQRGCPGQVEVDPQLIPIAATHAFNGTTKGWALTQVPRKNNCIEFGGICPPHRAASSNGFLFNTDNTEDTSNKHKRFNVFGTTTPATPSTATDNTVDASNKRRRFNAFGTTTPAALSTASTSTMTTEIMMPPQTPLLSLASPFTPMTPSNTPSPTILVPASPDVFSSPASMPMPYFDPMHLQYLVSCQQARKAHPASGSPFRFASAPMPESPQDVQTLQPHYLQNNHRRARRPSRATQAETANKSPQRLTPDPEEALESSTKNKDKRKVA
ncbi:hypothetical protein DFH09DRAFT_1099756 [Mycena vulgaris]|nr:hypothetical protein DFH09DRAFT_1099756 [Mycena vulgaris]